MFRTLTCLTGEHDWRLVVLAGVVCFAASIVAIDIFHRANASQGRTRLIWIAIAGAAIGYGIWATHFIAMLAYEPGVPTGYGAVLTASSLIIAMLVTSCTSFLGCCSAMRRLASQCAFRIDRARAQPRCS